MQGCEDQRGTGGRMAGAELSGRAIRAGHELEGMSHAAELAVCSINEAFHSGSVWSLAGPAQEHTEKEVHSQQLSLDSTDTTSTLFYKQHKEVNTKCQHSYPSYVH